MTVFEAKSYRLEFGVHHGQSLGGVAETDPTYIDWLAGETWPDLFLNQALPLICEHYGRKPKRAKARPNTGQLGLGI